MVWSPAGHLTIALMLSRTKLESAGLTDAVSSPKAAAVAAKRSRRSEVGALGKTVRLRDKDHRKFVLRQPCLVCGRVPSDPHHLTFIQPRALGRRVSDEFTVPVCRIHHRELHRSGNEAAWWRKLNIDPLPVALKLWQRTRADGELFASSEGDTRASAANTGRRVKLKIDQTRAVIQSPIRRARFTAIPRYAHRHRAVWGAVSHRHRHCICRYHDRRPPRNLAHPQQALSGLVAALLLPGDGEAASAAEIRSALDLLEARAQFDGPQRAVHVRIAEHGGHIYLDLADEHWRAVDIGPEGWRVIEHPPVRFRRPVGMLPLPVPERGGSIETLQSFLNLPSRNDFVLIVAWLLAALRSGGPYPLLAISGEQGSAKTVLSKLLKALIDPNAAPVRALSREERELMIAANNGYLLAFDNLSGLPSWLSDALCRLATGGSFAVRQLYTDDDEVLFEAARPILLNGIEDVISRPDLGDRAIFLTLASIGEAQRRPESELWREFEIARPRILGALLDAMVHGLRQWAVFTSRRCRAWPISRSARRRVKPHFGLPAPSRAPTRQIAEPPSRASSRQIP